MTGVDGPRLTARLAAVAAQVPAGARLADIGTDHALLPVALALDGRVASALAVDVRPGAVAAARRTVRRWDVASRVTVRCGDGLAAVAPGEADTIVVSGLGGPAIVAILTAAPAVLASVRRLVLAPQSGAWHVRRWLLAGGWDLRAEALVADRGRDYLVLVAERGAAAAAYDWPGRPACLTRAALLHLGPRLARAASPRWADHWRVVADDLDAIARRAAAGASPAAGRAEARWRRRAQRIRAAIAAATMVARPSSNDRADTDGYHDASPTPRPAIGSPP